MYGQQHPAYYEWIDSCIESVIEVALGRQHYDQLTTDLSITGDNISGNADDSGVFRMLTTEQVGE
jgi:hypothetical protein